MRFFLTLGVVFLFCACSPGPTEVQIKLASDKILAVKDFSTTPASEYSGCQVEGEIQFDVTVEPKNFTGVVSFENTEIKMAGWKSKQMNSAFQFINGKPHGYIRFYESSDDEDTKEKKEALCRVKSSSDIKLSEIGKAVMAFHGIKASVAN